MDVYSAPLTIDDTVQVISDVVDALAAIEGRVVHRDIKPENILLLDGRWCLADFWDLQIRGGDHWDRHPEVRHDPSLCSS